MNWLKRFFGIGESCGIERPPINEDWQPGDLAEAKPDYWDQRLAPLYKGADVPREGVSYIVTAVMSGTDTLGIPCWGLSFIGLNPGPLRGYCADGFRKIPPEEAVADEPRRATISNPLPEEVAA